MKALAVRPVEIRQAPSISLILERDTWRWGGKDPLSPGITLWYPNRGSTRSSLKYANNTEKELPCNLKVNGALVKNIPFGSFEKTWTCRPEATEYNSETVGWAKYWNARVIVDLNAGANTLELNVSSAAGGPHINNIADNPALGDVLADLRGKLDTWIVETGDKGGEPEDRQVLENEAIARKTRYEGLWEERGLSPELAESILYSEDGIHFKKTHDVILRGPHAVGAFPVFEKKCNLPVAIT